MDLINVGHKRAVHNDGDRINPGISTIANDNIFEIERAAKMPPNRKVSAQVLNLSFSSSASIPFSFENSLRMD
ncbi:hypothetical protein [Bradyrhizobium sp. URHD0069]|uniref:hypothetical protein n=1 Tax=Bradyrhizobium sp. URHD0069 TaxID=1380355 RepID=UPI000B04D53B|nr:hypothetical protein [Bradyrhizobium sp. URHD0069]